MRGTSRAVSVVRLEFDRYGLTATYCSAFENSEEAREAMRADFFSELRKYGEPKAEEAWVEKERAYLQWKDEKPMNGDRVEWSVHGGDEEWRSGRIKSRTSEVHYTVEAEVRADELDKWEALLSSRKVDYGKEGIEPNSCLWRFTVSMPDGMEMDFAVYSGDEEADRLCSQAILYDPKKSIPIARSTLESDLSGKWNLEFYDEDRKMLRAYTVNIIPAKGDGNGDKGKEDKEDKEPQR